MRQLEKMILLTTIDHLWKDHLLAMDHLREGIGLQGYGQKDPLIEYKKQGFGFFEMMMNQITGDVARKLFAVQLAPQESVEDMEEEVFVDPLRNAVESHADSQGMGLTPGFPEQRTPQPGSPVAAPTPGKMQYTIGPDGSLVASGPAQSAQPRPAQQPSAGVSPQQQRQAVDFANLMRGPSRMTMGRGPVGGGGGQAAPMPASGGGGGVGTDVEKVGRNDMCPCGSGKKYKKCHGSA